MGSKLQFFTSCASSASIIYMTESRLREALNEPLSLEAIELVDALFQVGVHAQDLVVQPHIPRL